MFLIHLELALESETPHKFLWSDTSTAKSGSGVREKEGEPSAPLRIQFKLSYHRREIRDCCCILSSLL